MVEVLYVRRTRRGQTQVAIIHRAGLSCSTQPPILTRMHERRWLNPLGGNDRKRCSFDEVSDDETRRIRKELDLVRKAKSCGRYQLIRRLCVVLNDDFRASGVRGITSSRWPWLSGVWIVSDGDVQQGETDITLRDRNRSPRRSAGQRARKQGNGSLWYL